eukprot:CAMPEP_0198229080 /NCGR_PEP_ID=MMETSP1445-20131203/113937_1 /TAXON_ID=36898 /ORGANISM="Pyramimonas sp., Strain CCMP2087" /LENGTH=328 /DNA_ID=CAMNT_0043909521 /DNA_START=98 /DNA_END=1084 /DNA_ORIENTATION=-
MVEAEAEQSHEAAEIRAEYEAQICEVQEDMAQTQAECLELKREVGRLRKDLTKDQKYSTKGQKDSTKGQKNSTKDQKDSRKHQKLNLNLSQRLQAESPSTGTLTENCLHATASDPAMDVCAYLASPCVATWLHDCAPSKPILTNSLPAAAEIEPIATNSFPAAAEIEPISMNSLPAAAEIEPIATNSLPAAAGVDRISTNSLPAAAEVGHFVVDQVFSARVSEDIEAILILSNNGEEDCPEEPMAAAERASGTATVVELKKLSKTPGLPSIVTEDHSESSEVDVESRRQKARELILTQQLEFGDRGVSNSDPRMANRFDRAKMAILSM